MVSRLICDGSLLFFFFLNWGYKTKKGNYLFLFCGKGHNVHSVKYSQILFKGLRNLIFCFFMTVNLDKSLNTLGLVCSFEKILKSAFHAFTKTLMQGVSWSESEMILL